jgi:predicted TIM-barrel fold metal-dependent hydrolase
MFYPAPDLPGFRSLMPRMDSNNLAVLPTFADHIVRDDTATRRVLSISRTFQRQTRNGDSAALLEQIRRIGMKRSLFGSDFNVLTPLQEIKDIDKLGLTKPELRTLQQNCAPWACP